jgi:hypothetical protein
MVKAGEKATWGSLRSRSRDTFSRPSAGSLGPLPSSARSWRWRRRKLSRKPNDSLSMRFMSSGRGMEEKARELLFEVARLREELERERAQIQAELAAICRQRSETESHLAAMVQPSAHAAHG